jgi:predicted nucleic acid-binding protein
VSVDTDILIDVSRGVPEALSSLNSLTQQHVLTVSVVTQMELVVGCRNATELRTLTAISQQLSLISKNQRDYRFIAELHLLTYPQSVSGQ